MNRVGDAMDHLGDAMNHLGDASNHLGDAMSHLGDAMNPHVGVLPHRRTHRVRLCEDLCHRDRGF